MKLYKIEVKINGFYYVAAEHPTEAQDKLIKHLNDISERDIKTIEFFIDSNTSAPVFNHQYRYLP